MSQNFIKKTFFIIFFLIAHFVASCSRQNSNETKLQKIEREDHQFCITLGLDFQDEQDGLKAEIYWRCRIILASHKMQNDITKENIENNALIKKLIKKLQENFVKIYEQWNDGRNTQFNNDDHEACVTMGYDIDTLDQSQVENYLECRRKLIIELQLVPPYRKIDYFRRPSDTYGMRFAQNKRLDDELELTKKAKETYPLCGEKFHFRTEDYKNCAHDFDQQKQCFTTIKQAKIARQLSEKSTCQRKSYLHFPDSLLKIDNAVQKEIERFNMFADFSNNHTLASLGLSQDDVDKFKAKDISVEEKKKSDKKKDFNTKNELYTKIELAKLRQRFIGYCDDDANLKIADYILSLENSCRAITMKWEEKKIPKK